MKDHDMKALAIWDFNGTILDDFERALGQSGASEEYARGVELIFQRTRDALGKLGVEAIEAEGKPFDPGVTRRKS